MFEQGNKDAEKWTLEEATALLEEAVKLSQSNSYDFIGEIAKKQGTYKEIYNYITKKFTELKPLLRQVKSNCEATCFYNGKNGDIIPSLAIMNLKSNHGWTDRIDTTTKDKELPTTTINLGNGLKPE